MTSILPYYGLAKEEFSIGKIGNGHIHQTYALKGKKSYVLQRINVAVFKEPQVIANNLHLAGEYLRINFPGYLFLQPLKTIDGKDIVYDSEGYPWRLFPFIENSKTLLRVSTREEAFSAASEFARLTSLLSSIDVSTFKQTISGFLDLPERYRQFERSLSTSSGERKKNAAACISACISHGVMIMKYHSLIHSGKLVERITHNDTKINNILFDERTGKAICVIDLDTLMPGYFIYDLGDMVRTFVSPVDEEEKDFSRILFRKEIYEAVIEGYLSFMGPILSTGEKEAIPLAGKMMTYITALRFTTDYLNGDVYYHTTYAGQNLVRAGNQLRLLDILEREVPG